mmetsp:Transcript_292/g.529  ORF Transcript_292/g.529 Transcript_292/m.529 type:complete len:521 (-) Transcript_292:315-1877(-)
MSTSTSRAQNSKKYIPEKGDVVWAVVEGYPHWPGVISDNDDLGTWSQPRGLYWVSFFGEDQGAWVNNSSISEFTLLHESHVPRQFKMKSYFQSQKFSKSRNVAIQLAAEYLRTKQEQPAQRTPQRKRKESTQLDLSQHEPPTKRRSRSKTQRIANDSTANAKNAPAAPAQSAPKQARSFIFTPPSKSQAPKTTKQTNTITKSTTDRTGLEHTNDEPTPSVEKDDRNSASAALTPLAGVKYSHFAEPVENALVWAHLRGFPWWPGIICINPKVNAYQRILKTRKVYWVQFLNDPSGYWLQWKPNQMKPLDASTAHSQLPPPSSKLYARVKIALDLALELMSESPEVVAQQESEDGNHMKSDPFCDDRPDLSDSHPPPFRFRDNEQSVMVDVNAKSSASSLKNDESLMEIQNKDENNRVAVQSEEIGDGLSKEQLLEMLESVRNENSQLKQECELLKRRFDTVNESVHVMKAQLNRMSKPKSETPQDARIMQLENELFQIKLNMRNFHIFAQNRRRLQKYTA